MQLYARRRPNSTQLVVLANQNVSCVNQLSNVCQSKTLDNHQLTLCFIILNYKYLRRILGFG